jgi:UDP-glucose 4-epimerase
MNIMVTGGAGYVGSVVSEELVQRGHNVVVFDNLQQGHRQALMKEVELVQADIRDADKLDEVLKRRKIEAVVHMAGETVVEYSMTRPDRYFWNNVIGGITLLDAMMKNGVKKLVFSSSASVYGEPKQVPIQEDHEKLPVNSYGESKLMFEHVLAWYGKAFGLRHISMRYFNVAGASQRFGEDHRPETHLIPAILGVAVSAQPMKVFGNDYPTKDGSCVRDYVHVQDIAIAHLLALTKIDNLQDGAYNLGSGTGYSNLEMVEAARRATGKNISVQIYPRRAGDPAVLITDNSKARRELLWNPERTNPEKIVGDAWRWMSSHPNGYTE